MRILITTVFFMAQFAGEARAADGDLPPELQEGRQLFVLQCARCHGMHGAGGTGANLRRPKLLNAASDHELFAVIKAGIDGTEMPGSWFMTDKEIRQLIPFVRSLGKVAKESLTGDRDNGKRLYEKSDCAKCHRIGREGGTRGPNLTDIGDRRGSEFFRRTILHPGQNVPVDSGGYRKYMVVLALTEDDRVISGTRINEDSFTIQIRDNEDRIWSLRKSNLQVLKKTDGSIMPNYVQQLSPTDIEDIVSWLASLAKEE